MLQDEKEHNSHSHANILRYFKSIISQWSINVLKVHLFVGQFLLALKLKYFVIPPQYTFYTCDGQYLEETYSIYFPQVRTIQNFRSCEMLPLIVTQVDFLRTWYEVVFLQQTKPKTLKTCHFFSIIQLQLGIWRSCLKVRNNWIFI